MFSRAYAREALLRRARGVIWALRAVSAGNVTGFESLWVSCRVLAEKWWIYETCGMLCRWS